VTLSCKPFTLNFAANNHTHSQNVALVQNHLQDPAALKRQVSHILSTGAEFVSTSAFQVISGLKSSFLLFDWGGIELYFIFLNFALWPKKKIDMLPHSCCQKAWLILALSLLGRQHLCTAQWKWHAFLSAALNLQTLVWNGHVHSWIHHRSVLWFVGVPETWHDFKSRWCQLVELRLVNISRPQIVVYCCLLFTLLQSQNNKRYEYEYDNTNTTGLNIRGWKTRWQL